MCLSHYGPTLSWSSFAVLPEFGVCIATQEGLELFQCRRLPHVEYFSYLLPFLFQPHLSLLQCWDDQLAAFLISLQRNCSSVGVPMSNFSPHLSPACPFPQVRFLDISPCVMWAATVLIVASVAPSAARSASASVLLSSCHIHNPQGSPEI